MDDDRHWLERPRTITWLWRGGIAILALTVLADLLYEPHPYFVVDGWLGFHAAFGFLACLAMVLFAKLLGLWVKRPDSFYLDEDGSDDGGGGG